MLLLTAAVTAARLPQAQRQRSPAVRAHELLPADTSSNGTMLLLPSAPPRPLRRRPQPAQGLATRASLYLQGRVGRGR